MPAGIYRICVIFMSGISVILEILISLFDFILLGWRYRSVTGEIAEAVFQHTTVTFVFFDTQEASPEKLPVH